MFTGYETLDQLAADLDGPTPAEQAKMDADYRAVVAAEAKRRIVAFGTLDAMGSVALDVDGDGYVNVIYGSDRWDVYDNDLHRAIDRELGRLDRAPS